MVISKKVKQSKNGKLVEKKNKKKGSAARTKEIGIKLLTKKAWATKISGMKESR